MVGSRVDDAADVGACAAVSRAQLTRLCETRVVVSPRMARPLLGRAAAPRASRLTAAGRRSRGKPQRGETRNDARPSVGARVIMRKALKLIFYSALILFVGLPAAFVLFVAGMSIFSVVVGVGFGILGLILTALKFALVVVLPIALLVWVAKRLMA